MSVESSRPHGEVFLDARGHGRALRLTWHHESDVVVLSLWRDSLCAGTFRLATADVNDFVDALVEGLRAPVGPSAAPVPSVGLPPAAIAALPGPEPSHDAPPTIARSA